MRALTGLMTVPLALGMLACGRGDGLTPSSDTFTLRVYNAGGFVPPGADQAAVPEFALTADGRALTGGPMIEIYPGPAMPNVLQRQITQAGIDALEAEARAAGLFGPDAHYDHNGVADAATTFFIVDADGARHVISAYALGMDAMPGPGSSSSDTEARKKLQRFRERLGDLGAWLPAGSIGDEEPYEMTALRVVARPGTDSPDDGVPASEKDWPLSTPLATFGEAVGDTRCEVVDGDDLTTLLPHAREATQITLWRSGDATYLLQFRPQVPEERGCEVPSRSDP